ncbi:MAG: hemerythrin domain-containing protein [Actinomycetota bacterium]|nr:hemerythrin domain-containing protein [Actinomycetota bacterium]
MPDAISVIEKDHRTVDAMFNDYETVIDEARKEEVAPRIVRELSIHAALEEMLVYPVVRLKVDGGDDMVDHAVEEHQEAKRLLADIEKAGSGSQRDQLMKELAGSIREHIAEEEGDVLPRLRECVDAERLEQMGTLMERSRGLMPTHPHPMVPGTAAAQLLAGPLASVADHIRDFVDSLRRSRG